MKIYLLSALLWLGVVGMAIAADPAAQMTATVEVNGAGYAEGPTVSLPLNTPVVLTFAVDRAVVWRDCTLTDSTGLIKLDEVPPEATQLSPAAWWYALPPTTTVARFVFHQTDYADTSRVFVAGCQAEDERGQSVSRTVVFGLRAPSPYQIRLPLITR